MQELTDIEILERNCGGVVIKDMTALTFLGWLAGKLNNLSNTNNVLFAELRIAVAHPPPVGKLANESKINYVRKLLALGLEI